MTSPDLSPAVEAYFDLMDGPDRSGIVDLFTDDATVVDERLSASSTDLDDAP